MHESTRRFVCRAGFLLGCVFPTLLVAAWIGYLHSSTYREQERLAWQETMSRQLGLDVSLTSVAHPEPNLTWLEGVELKDPETGRTLASSVRLELAKHDEGWVVFVGDAQVPRVQLSRLVEVAHPTLWRRAGHAAPVWQLVVGSLQIVSDDAPFTLLDVQLTGQGGDGESTNPQLQVEFRVAGIDMNQPARVTVTRNRQTDPPTSAWAFQTGPQALPASLLALALPPLAELGDEAQISGQCVVRESAQGWSGEGQGRITQIDLDRVVTGAFPHKLTGVADLVVSRAAWEQGRLIDAAGTLTSGGGAVSRSLLASASDENALQWQMSPRVAENEQPLWRYRELAFGFQLNDQGIQIAGQCSGADPGAIFADAHGPLVSEGPQPWLSTVAAVRFLAPQSEIQVPASVATEGLLRRLPLPPATQRERSLARPGYSPLKLR
ncbi:MAG: hypothetical protein U0939_02950 [Pirellulales bacterium]